MKRTQQTELVKTPDVAPFIRAIQFLDAVLKQGVVVGVEDEKVTIDDKQLVEACANARRHIDLVTGDLERLARVVTRLQPGSIALQ